MLAMVKRKKGSIESQVKVKKEVVEMEALKNREVPLRMLEGNTIEEKDLKLIFN